MKRGRFMPTPLLLYVVICIVSFLAMAWVLLYLYLERIWA